MRHTYYVPSESTRHRIASLALFRALIRTGSRVPLPTEVPHGGPRHPVVHIIRRRFESHRNYTSLRLVYAAMTAGYKFLSLLVKAQKEGSKEHDEVVEHLRTRRISPPKVKDQFPEERPMKPPMITKTTPSFAPAKYKPTYTPHPDPTKRRVPLLGTASEGIPYLRFSKPQRPILNQIIRRRRQYVVDMVDKVKDLEEYVAPEAVLEDLWEAMIEKQIKEETGQGGRTKDVEETYAWSVMLSKLWYEYKAQAFWDDIVAKGEAMWDIVQAERKQAIGTKVGASGTEGNMAERKRVVPLRTPQEHDRKNIKVLKGRMMPIMQEAHKIAASIRRRGEGAELDNQIDPFRTALWQELQRRYSGRMLLWLNSTTYYDPSVLVLRQGSVQRAADYGEEEAFANFLAAPKQ